MQVHVEIKNAQQIKSAFRMAPYLMTKNLSRAIKASALNIQRASMRITPVKTGFLKNSHVTAMTSPLSGYVEPTADYALFVHDGTRFMKSRPFLSDAVETEQGFVDAEFEKAVQDTLDTIGAKV